MKSAYEKLKHNQKLGRCGDHWNDRNSKSLSSEHTECQCVWLCAGASANRDDLFSSQNITSILAALIAWIILVRKCVLYVCLHHSYTSLFSQVKQVAISSSRRPVWCALLWRYLQRKYKYIPLGHFLFAHHPPRTLPAHIRSLDKLSTFKRQLKSHLFQSAFAVYSPSASASDSFNVRFWRYINLHVCMYVCITMVLVHGFSCGKLN